MMASTAQFETAIRPDLVFAEHDGTTLIGDLYLPQGRRGAPVLVAVHGGGWQIGDRSFYRHWGPLLARNGYAVFAIEYRLGKAGVYPAAVCDVRAAVQFVRAKAGEFALDPDRIGADRGFRRCASVGAHSARRRSVRILLSERCPCGGAFDRQGGGRILRRV